MSGTKVKLAMKWSQIRALTESKPIQLTTVALFLVPISSKLWSVSTDSFLLYLAAIFISVGSLIYSIRRPSIVPLDTLKDAFDRGWDGVHLAQQLDEIDRGIGWIDREYERLNTEGTTTEQDRFLAFKTQIENAPHANNFARNTFVLAKKIADDTRLNSRVFITFFLALALCCLLLANVCRAVDVAKTYFFDSDEDVIMAFHSVYISVGKEVKVNHEDGSGGSKESTGILISPNDGGSIVIKNEETDEIILIPVGKVYEVRQTALDNDENVKPRRRYG